MKAKFTILILFVSITLWSQEPAVFTLKKSLTTYRIDTINNRFVEKTWLKANDQISLSRPIFVYIANNYKGNYIGLISEDISNYPQYNYALTTSGEYVELNDMMLSVVDMGSFSLWSQSLRKEYYEYTERLKVEKEQKAKEAENAATLTDFMSEQINKMNRIKATSKAIVWHDYMTVFTGGSEFNLCHSQLLEFLAKHMKMSEQSNEYKNGYIVTKFNQRTSKGNPEHLTIKYKVKSESGYFFPEQVEITGTQHRIIELFVYYWPTEIQSDQTNPGNEYTCYMLSDKITLSIDKSGKAKIMITTATR